MTALETAKSLAPSTVLVLRMTSFRASADLRCRLLATVETSTQSSARYASANPLRHLYTVIANLNLILNEKVAYKRAIKMNKCEEDSYFSNNLHNLLVSKDITGF